MRSKSNKSKVRQRRSQ